MEGLRWNKGVLLNLICEIRVANTTLLSCEAPMSVDVHAHWRFASTIRDGLV
jgi:hypothetical protein